MGLTVGAILLLCLFTVTVTANVSPEILTDFESLCEDIPKGGYAFTIRATDDDNDPLTYSITSQPFNHFRVISNTGVVEVNNPLDREDSGRFNIEVTVSDGRNAPVSKDVIIILKDANDNKPIFEQSSYDCDVLENATVGTPLFKVEATDADSDSIITYLIDQVVPVEGFSLFTIEGRAGQVVLDGSLNHTALSSFYRLRVVASDRGISCYRNETVYWNTTAYALVNVVDLPDMDPVFLRPSYVGDVDEHSPVHVSVLKVTAIDQDSGVNSDITYSIESATVDGLFAISKDGGWITVSSDIDRETVGDTVFLIVKATEVTTNIHGIQATATVPVEITINDINDREPQFFRCGGPEAEPECVPASHFTVQVLEHTLEPVDLNMTVRDPDQNSRILLSLNETDSDIFSVEPRLAVSQSEVWLVVQQPAELEYEKESMVLEIIAIDQEKASFNSTATVTILIMDANDERPRFTQELYHISVPEHSAEGTVIETIVAEDPDTMDQGKLVYTLLPRSIRTYFDVEPRTGEIFVTNSTLLDREGRSLYLATLEAKDTSGKRDTTELEITLTDINDQIPVFNRDSYQYFVEEGKQVHLQIQATDGDEIGTNNSQIVYGILPSKYSDYFQIDPDSGLLTNKVELDREAVDPALDGDIELNVTATDKGVPALSSEVTVTINVQDVNDNIPEFNASSYKFYVKEGEKGAYVGSVEAHDLDQTSDLSRITFSIVSGGADNFVIRTHKMGSGYVGNISVDPGVELDYEGPQKIFSLRVEAADFGQQKDFAEVVVEMVDVNDERPAFTPTGPLTVKENTTMTAPVGKFSAVDKDSNHSLVYTLESLRCRCNGSVWQPCDWFILKPSGDITVNPEETVDYETCDQAVMVAQVVDEWTEKGANDSATPGEVVINIEDINDNTPEFIPSNFAFVVVSESASKGTSVAQVTATDGDTEEHRRLKFDITSVQFEDTSGQITNMRIIFTTVTTQQNDIYLGLIQSLEELNPDLKGKYLVTVSATDSGGLSSRTTVEIFTVDKTFKIELRFTTSVEQVLQDLDDIILALTAATKASVQVFRIVSEVEETTTRVQGATIMEAYFISRNGTALTSDTVARMLSDPEHFLILGQFGLTYIGTVPGVAEESDPLRFILLGMVAGLIIVLMVLTTSLVCTRKNYRRKLKAAKAMNNAEMLTSENQKGGAVVPGTNKYTMEGANPVLNLNIDTAMVLGLDGESSDGDKISLNSLDYNDGMVVSEKDSSPFVQRSEEEEEEDQGPPEYIEPLSAALAQRGMKTIPDRSSSAFTNPAFSTTDL